MALIRIILFVCLLITPLWLFAQKKLNKTALIIGISKYAPESGWSNINTENDVLFIKEALIKQGFSESEITILKNEAATKEGILKAIEEQLIQKAKVGGVAVFHFSGHGQQVQDDNGDELDGYDEALVPYDSPLKYQKGVNEGEKLLRDEELGLALLRLRKKLGKKGEVVVILDSCHSGTGTRGWATARGTHIPMADESYTAKNQADEVEINQLARETLSDKKNQAPMIAFFGASAKQLNYETQTEDGKKIGSLSLAFSQAFSEARLGSSYRALFDKIKMEMSRLVPGQSPQVEGSLDKEVLGANILGKAAHFTITANDWWDDKTLNIQEGTLAGLFPGTKVGLYPTDTRNFKEANPKVEGTVTEASLRSSTVSLDNAISKKEALDSWIFVTHQTYGELDLNIQLVELEKELESDLKEKMKEFPFIKTVEGDADLFIHHNKEEGKIQILTAGEYEIYSRTAKGRLAAISHNLVEQMLAYIQCKFLRGLEMEEEDLKMEVELVPVLLDTLVRKKKSIPLDAKRFLLGEKFKLKLYNKGNIRAYYTVMDIRPDNLVDILIPSAETTRTVEELYLNPGKSVEHDVVFTIGEPLGTDILKLVATADPIDLRDIIIDRGQDMGAEAHPFEQLFAKTYLYYQDRGESNWSLDPELSIFSMVYTIER